MVATKIKNYVATEKYAVVRARESKQKYTQKS